jgi:hypothetical protein
MATSSVAATRTGVARTVGFLVLLAVNDYDDYLVNRGKHSVYGFVESVAIKCGR